MQNSISNVPTILPGCFAIHNYHFTLKGQVLKEIWYFFSGC